MSRRKRKRQLGHCIYCGGFSYGSVCPGHRDLPRRDPAFDRYARVVPSRHWLSLR